MSKQFLCEPFYSFLRGTGWGWSEGVSSFEQRSPDEYFVPCEDIPRRVFSLIKYELTPQKTDIKTFLKILSEVLLGWRILSTQTHQREDVSFADWTRWVWHNLFSITCWRFPIIFCITKGKTREPSKRDPFNQRYVYTRSSGPHSLILKDLVGRSFTLEGRCRSVVDCGGGLSRPLLRRTFV